MNLNMRYDLNSKLYQYSFRPNDGLQRHAKFHKNTTAKKMMAIFSTAIKSETNSQHT